MKLDVPTLVFTLGLTILTQVIAIFIQYRVNRTYRGIGWWLLGSALIAMGFLSLALGKVEYVWVLSFIGNPLLVLGRICLLVGILRFMDKKENRWVLGSVFVSFLVLYYYYLFGHEDIASRTVIVSAAIALFSFMIARSLMLDAHKSIAGSARFTGATFLAHGCYLIVNICDTLLSVPIHSYAEYNPIQVAAFIVPAITSTLWTFGFILMVNQRLNAENLEEKENLRQVFNTSPDDITITDLEGRVLMVSPAAHKLFGYGQGEEAGRHLLDFIVPEDMERARTNIIRMFHGGHQKPNEYRGVRKDQSHVDIEVNSGLIHGVQGQPIKMVFVVRDITERRKTEAEKEELASRNRQLQKAESLGRMAGAIAHHFNNQLQSVLASLELLNGLPKGADPSRWLTGAKQAAERAAEVSRLMLAYLGQASREQEPVLLSELCRSSLPVIQGTLPRMVTVETDFPEPGPVVSANADQIEMVLTNLITNAWEAIGEAKGSIRLSLKTCRAADIPTKHRFPVNWQPKQTDYACLTVRDTGSGIAEADIEKLFDPFFSTKFIGRGLGLSVVLGIVQAHGGALTVESEGTQGSIFQIHFPLCTQAPPNLAAGDARAPEPVPGGTILLVDDDEFLLMSTGAVVEMSGYTLLTARDGVEALEVFRQHRDRIRCVITDLTMPRMDGWETLTALRQLEPTLPVILMSGYDKAQVMSGAHPILPHAFLGKPFGLQNLRDALNQALVRANTGQR